jgi:hypothetical protein
MVQDTANKEFQRTLITEVTCPLLIEEGRDELGDDNVTRIPNVKGDVGHHHNKYMLLSCKLAGIDYRGKPIGPASSERVGK